MQSVGILGRGRVPLTLLLLLVPPVIAVSVFAPARRSAHILHPFQDLADRAQRSTDGFRCRLARPAEKRERSRWGRVAVIPLS